jgi:hypothetical protein
MCCFSMALVSKVEWAHCMECTNGPSGYRKEILEFLFILFHNV